MTIDRIAAKIEEMDNGGAKIEQIQREVQKMIGTRSPWRKELATQMSTCAIEGIASAR